MQNDKTKEKFKKIQECKMYVRNNPEKHLLRLTKQSVLPTEQWSVQPAAHE